MSIRLAPLLVVGCVLVSASPAFAGVASAPRDPSTGAHRLEYRAEPGESSRLSMSHATTGGVRVEDTGAPLAPGENCRSDGPNAVVCVAEQGYFDSAAFDLGDGDDHLTLGLLEATVNAGPGDDQVISRQVKVDVDGGPGADLLQGLTNSRLSYADRTGAVTVIQDGLPNDGEAGEGDNVGPGFTHLTGGAGDDELHLDERHRNGLWLRSSLEGGAGDDRLFGTDSPDRIEGGAGDDELYGFAGDFDFLDGGPGADLIRGGAGFDGAAPYDGTRPVDITLDDRPGDGPAGENDDVGADVESIAGTPFDDRLIGSDAANGISGLGGRDLIDGRGGTDDLRGSGRIVGGPDHDTISTGDPSPFASGDLIPVGPGVLTLIDTRDVYDDTITCARGSVRLTIDPVDELRLCAPVVVGPRPDDFRVARDGTVRMRLRCASNADVRCAGRVYVRRSGGGPVVGRARFKLPAKGRSAVVAARLTSRYRAELQRARRLRVDLQVVTYRPGPATRKLEKPVPGRTLLAPR